MFFTNTNNRIYKKEHKNEIPKHLKQKESNVSKSKKKSKHKHQYEECLLQYKQKYNFLSEKERNEIQTSLTSYCIICGKIGTRLDNSIVTDYLKTVDTSIGKCYQCITDQELYERYHDRLPVFFIDDYWKDNYVDLEQKYELCELYKGEY